MPACRRYVLGALLAGLLTLVAAPAASAQPAPPVVGENPAPPGGAPAPAQLPAAPQAPVPGADPAAPAAEPGIPAEPAADGVVVPDVADVPEITVSVGDGDTTLSRTVVLILLLTIGSVAPGILLLMTTFTRFVVVLGLAKNALALQTVPPAQVLVGLALFLTFFVMNPVFSDVNEDAIQPLLAGTIDQDEALAQGYAPLREFMLAQTREEDLRLFTDLASGPRPASRADVPASTLIPAFAISELRSAFIIGFVIFIPFLVIDLVVAAVLMSMGMVMLPPVFISLPLKLLLFVLVDGWVLIVGSMVQSVNGVVL
jgi:flagellar biosynthetic protein FliP